MAEARGEEGLTVGDMMGAMTGLRPAGRGGPAVGGGLPPGMGMGMGGCVISRGACFGPACVLNS